MQLSDLDYSFFLDFFNAFSTAGIEGVHENDPMKIKLDRLMEKNKQVVYLADAVLMDILFISNSVSTHFGIEPEKVSIGYFMTTTHPDDIKRHHLARAQLVRQAQELYIQKKGSKIISTNVRARKADGSYFNALYQAYFFYSKVPYESVFLILVITDISAFKKIHKRFHSYSGEDLSFFRFPDEELLLSGSPFSLNEFKIIELIDEGLSNKEIAERLFRSVYTINTHRTNILKKSGRHTIGEVIHDLKERGLL